MSNQRPIKTAWFKNRNSREKEELEYVLRNNVLLKEAILSILETMKDTEERKEIRPDAYENPSWAYKQADINGAKRVIEEIRSLFIFD